MSQRSPPSSCRRARSGDVVTIQLLLTPENGFVPVPLFDTTGVVTFVLGWGNYLPALHELVEGCCVGDSVKNLSIDAGWGERQEDLIVEVPKHKLASYDWKLGESFLLKGMRVYVTQDLGDKVVLDANSPLAGSSYSCTFEVLAIEDAPTNITNNSTSQESTTKSRYHVASFALGCFWGAELAFMRQEGVVGTKVGYSQGRTRDPTYDEVCEGRTQHRETVLVLYDPEIVTYARLLQVAAERLAVTAPHKSSSGLNLLFGDSDSSSMQYKHGFYYHDEEQRTLGEEEISRNNNRFGVELLQADTFYDAEEYHQKYLYKGGQSARKGSREVIRCYG